MQARILPPRCFDDTKQLRIWLAGTWLPRTIFGFATVVCAIMRMYALAWYLIWLHWRRQLRCSIIVVDQVRLQHAALRQL